MSFSDGHCSRLQNDYIVTTMIKPLSKIIQIIPGPERAINHYLTALCEDGSVWERRARDGGVQWILIVPKWVDSHTLPDMGHSGWQDCLVGMHECHDYLSEAESLMEAGDHERAMFLLDQVKERANGTILKIAEVKEDPDAFRGSTGR